jgi:hypothetical protein
MTKRWHLGAVALLLLAYWTISLRHLAVVPPVYEDEPWISSAGWKLANEGIFGLDMFAGYYGLESRNYLFMPIYPLLLAPAFSAEGLGLFQARLVLVVAGGLVLVLTYALGRRLFESAVGLLAVLFLLLVRLTTVTPSQLTGIVFLDIARIARYDMLVPMFGLAALHVYHSMTDRQEWPGYFLAGLLTGLAGLSNVYGLFFTGALAILGLWQRASIRNLIAMAAGAGLPWLSYLAYVLADLPTWSNQTAYFAPRFDLLNWRWYRDNLLREPLRYQPGLGPLGWYYLGRPGFWAAVVAIPLSLVALGRRVKRAGRLGDPGPAVLFVPAVLLPIAFALLIYSKLINYSVAFWPLLALVVAWGSTNLWRRLAAPAAGRHLSRPRVLMLVLLLAVFLEGFDRIRVLERAAKQTTPYTDYIAQVRTYLPENGLILGLHNYWFGLDDYDYRSWAVPLFWQSDLYEQPRTLAAGLDELAPVAVLIDRRMRDLFAGDPVSGQIVRQWLAERGYELTGVVDDGTYGQMEVFRSPPVQ